MTSFTVDNKENIDMNGFGQYYTNMLHINDEEPMDIDSSICINDRTLNTSKINTFRQQQQQQQTTTASTPPPLPTVNTNINNRMQFQPQQQESNDNLNNNANNSLLSTSNANNSTANEDCFMNNSNKYTSATEQVIFDSIFSNDLEFEAFLEVLEKKDADPRITKFSEFARKSLYIQFDPLSQRISNRLSPDKLKRLSILREQKEAIKTKFNLNEIEEEPQNQHSPLNNSKSQKAAQDAIALLKHIKKQPSIIEKSEQEQKQLVDILTDPNIKLDVSASNTHLDNTRDNNLDESSSKHSKINTNNSHDKQQQHNHANDSIIDIEKCKIDFSHNSTANIHDQSSASAYNFEVPNNIRLSNEESNKMNNSTSSTLNDDLLVEIKRLRENDKQQHEKIRFLEDENRKYQKIAAEFENIFQNLIRDNEENESKLKAEILELTKERDHLQEDVIGVEKAFDDLHRRFENLKKKVEDFKKNEDQLQKNSEILKQQIDKEKNKYATLKKHAEEKIELANNEIEKLRKSSQVEIQTLKAEWRKAEIKISSLELSVQQKDSENSQLTNLLEDLLSKVKPNSY